MAAWSMTGMGYGRIVEGDIQVEAEVRSVNRKQFDLELSGAMEVLRLEPVWRGMIQQRISRGRVQCQIRVSSLTGGETGYDAAVLRGAVHELRALAETLDVPFDMRLEGLLALPGATRSRAAELSPEQLEHGGRAALTMALDAWQTMREQEGSALATDLLTRLARLADLRDEIVVRAPTVPQHYCELLRKRIAALGVSVEVDDVALAREVAICADRCDISEEMTRLASHLVHFRGLLADAKPMGRQCDFLCQEMHREVNTTGSKANDAEISRRVIEMKAIIEAIREQVQNLE